MQLSFYSIFLFFGATLVSNHKLQRDLNDGSRWCQGLHSNLSKVSLMANQTFDQNSPREGFLRNLICQFINGDLKEPLSDELKVNGNLTEPLWTELKVNENLQEPLSTELKENGNQKEPLSTELKENGNLKDLLWTELKENKNLKDPLWTELKENGNLKDPLSTDLKVNGNLREPLSTELKASWQNDTQEADRAPSSNMQSDPLFWEHRKVSNTSMETRYTKQQYKKEQAMTHRHGRKKRETYEWQLKKGNDDANKTNSDKKLLTDLNETLQSPAAGKETEPHTLSLNGSIPFATNDLKVFSDNMEVNQALVPKNTTNNKKLHIKNPFYPLTEDSYGAYTVMCLSIIIFVIGIMGNMAVMCIVCHNYYMRSISNSLLANLAFWDFLIIFFCLPLVIFHELTKKWLLEDFSCKIIPYIEVASLGVTTFTLCALCIDRFRAATNVQMYYEMIENCTSTTAKLAVIWVGALLLALPEVVLRQLNKDESALSANTLNERCVVKISTDLPDTIYVLALTYDGARLWWYFGCYFCLPTLFTITCSLVTARKIKRAEKACTRGNKRQIQLEGQMNCTVVALTILYGFCIIPENICNIVTAYMSTGVSRQTLDLLHLISQFLLFFKSCVTPVLLFCLCKPFSRAFMECCCCCCDECIQKSSTATSDDNDNEYTTELELSPFSTIRREMSTFASVGTHC